MIQIRPEDSIYHAKGKIENGTFSGRWHFSFGEYYDEDNMNFGALRVFNDDTLSPGATWPLHPHKEIEVVTYCAGGEFKHADEHGTGGILKKGWVQHTTVGSGMWHSEINNRSDQPMRFIQMWIAPERKGLSPSVEQKQVDIDERTDKLLPIVSRDHPEALPIRQDAAVYSGFLRSGKEVTHRIRQGRCVYFYVVEGGPAILNGRELKELWAAKIIDEPEIRIKAISDVELLLVETVMI